VVEALIALMASEKSNGEVFNVGGNQEISILDLANKIIRMAGSTSSIQLVPYEKAFGKDFEDMQRRVPGTEKLAQAIGFTPEKSLEYILERVIAYLTRI
jgi:UDP-glucose 4-epimerase